MQATAHTKVPRTIVTKRLSFLCLQLVDASFCQFWLQEASQEASFPYSSDFLGHHQGKYVRYISLLK